MEYTELDQRYMRQALDEAKKALDANEYPVAALLVVDSEPIEVLSNRNVSHDGYASHAECLVMQKNSSLIRQRTRRLSSNEELPGKIELYTTLEPCMMCLGSALLHKVKRIIYACPDPRGGVTSAIDPLQLSDFYQKKWPEIVGGVLLEESYQMITSYQRNQPEDFWHAITQTFEEMHSKLKG